MVPTEPTWSYFLWACHSQRGSVFRIRVNHTSTQTPQIITHLSAPSSSCRLFLSEAETECLLGHQWALCFGKLTSRRWSASNWPQPVIVQQKVSFPPPILATMYFVHDHLKKKTICTGHNEIFQLFYTMIFILQATRTFHSKKPYSAIIHQI